MLLLEPQYRRRGYLSRFVISFQKQKNRVYFIHSFCHHLTIYVEFVSDSLAGERDISHSSFKRHEAVCRDTCRPMHSWTWIETREISSISTSPTGCLKTVLQRYSLHCVVPIWSFNIRTIALSDLVPFLEIVGSFTPSLFHWTSCSQKNSSTLLRGAGNQSF